MIRQGRGTERDGGLLPIRAHRNIDVRFGFGSGHIALLAALGGTPYPGDISPTPGWCWRRGDGAFRFPAGSHVGALDREHAHAPALLRIPSEKRRRSRAGRARPHQRGFCATTRGRCEYRRSRPAGHLPWVATGGSLRYFVNCGRWVGRVHQSGYPVSASRTRCKQATAAVWRLALMPPRFRSFHRTAGRSLDAG